MTKAWVNTVVAAAALCTASACTIGTSKDDATNAGDSDDNPACPHAKLDDVWLDQRLGCLSVGQFASAKVADTPGDRTDRAYVVKQHTLDSAFNNVLGSDVLRAFKYLVCVHDAPPTIDYGVPFATDLLIAFRVGAPNPDVGASTLTMGGSLDTSCDPTIHPVILDGDGVVESINPDALGALEITDGR